MDRDNRRRAMAEVVSLDAFHKGFTTSRKAVDLHVEVSFMTGRIGADPDSPVRFKLRLKRAEIVVIVPLTEPAKVDRFSVRGGPVDAKVKSTTTRKTTRKGGAGIAVEAGTRKVGGGAKAAASASHSAETALQISQNLKTMSVLHRVSATGEDVWVVETVVGEALHGSPWHATKDPLLKVTDTRADRTRGIEPNVRVEVRCLREDLEISEVALKGQASWTSFANPTLNRNRQLAAEAVIRTRLVEAGLLHGDINDPYAPITLCAIIAEAQS